jgi:putative DNA primase/helicase
MSIEAVKSRIDWAKPYVAPRTEQARPPLRSLNVKELLELEISPREMILNPILPAQGLVMLYAPRGCSAPQVFLLRCSLCR